MAVVAVSNSNNRLTDADATTGWASDGGGGAGPQNEPDLGYQLTSGSNLSVSRKVGTTKGGHGYTHGSTIDMTAEANQVFMAKCVWYNSINAVAYPACGIKIGNSATVYKEYSRIDDGSQGDLDADPKKLVYIIPVDPNVVAWADIISGTPPTLSAIDFFGIQGDFGGSAKAENVAMDAIDLARGIGVLWLVGGDGADPDGTLENFLAHDEGILANRFGHISKLEGAIFQIFGTLWIGRTETPTATATVFQDSGRIIIFPKGFFDAGWTGLAFDLGSATTDIDLTDYSLSGLGQDDKKSFFDSITEIDAGADTVTLDHDDYITGTPLRYSKEGGSDTTGLTDATLYWWRRTAANVGELHATRNGARTAGTAVNLSDGSTGENHSLTREPDIRPDFTCVGTSGALDIVTSTFDKIRKIVMTSAMTILNCVIRGAGLIDITTNNGGTVDGCRITGQTTRPGDALIKADTLANIKNNDATLAVGEKGHFAEIDATGTYALNGNLLTGYWASPDNGKGAEFNSSSGVDGGTEVVTTAGLHGFSTGDEVWYNDNGGAVNMGLTDGVRYYVNVISTTTLSFHRSRENAIADTNRVNLTAGASETHTLYSGNAAIVNSSGGLVTINVGSGGTAPSVRNVGAATTVVNVTFDYTLTNIVAGTEIRLFDDDVDPPVELAGIESSGTSFTYQHDGTAKNIFVTIQKLTHKWLRINDSIASADKSQKVFQQPDPDYVNPA